MRLEKHVDSCFRNTDVPSIYFLLFLVCEKLWVLVYLKICTEGKVTRVLWLMVSDI